MGLFFWLRRRRERATGIVTYFSAADRRAWVAPHNNLSIITVDATVLKRSGFFRDPLRAGDRVAWLAHQGGAPRRLWRYRRAEQG